MGLLSRLVVHDLWGSNCTDREFSCDNADLVRKRRAEEELTQEWRII